MSQTVNTNIVLNPGVDTLPDLDTSTIHGFVQSVELANYTYPPYIQQSPRWKLCRDMMVGTDAVRSQQNAPVYLPIAEAEEPADWRTRVMRTELNPLFKITVRGLVGLGLRKDVQLGSDVPEDIKTHWEDIDRQGTHGAAFVRNLFRDGLVTGLNGILVDYPAAPIDPDTNRPRTLTKAEEAALNFRPYWVHYTAEQILSVQTKFSQAGMRVITRLVLWEQIEEDNGPFGMVTVDVYRVFWRDLDRPVGNQITYQQYRVDPNAHDMIPTPMYTEPIPIIGPSAIPFVMVYYGDKAGIGLCDPPLLDLAYTNVAHAQVLSDHRHAIHVASVPILVMEGLTKRRLPDGTEEEIKVSSNEAVTPPKDHKVYYAETTGSSIGQTREELKDIEARAAVQGLTMLSNQTFRPETADAKRIDRAQQDSMLATAVRSLGDALELALQYHAEWIKLALPENDGGSVTVSMDFTDTKLDGATIQVFSQMVAQDQLSLNTLWDVLIAGDWLPADFDKDTELAQILAQRATTMTPGTDTGVDTGTDPADTGTDTGAPGDTVPDTGGAPNA